MSGPSNGYQFRGFVIAFSVARCETRRKGAEDSVGEPPSISAAPSPPDPKRSLEDAVPSRSRDRDRVLGYERFRGQQEANVEQTMTPTRRLQSLLREAAAADDEATLQRPGRRSAARSFDVLGKLEFEGRSLRGSAARRHPLRRAVGGTRPPRYRRRPGARPGDAAGSAQGADRGRTACSRNVLADEEASAARWFLLDETPVADVLEPSVGDVGSDLLHGKEAEVAAVGEDRGQQRADLAGVDQNASRTCSHCAVSRKKASNRPKFFAPSMARLPVWISSRTLSVGALEEVRVCSSRLALVRRCPIYDPKMLWSTICRT